MPPSAGLRPLPESQASLGSRVVGAPATWLVLFVGLSTFVRAWIGLRVPSPWILPDEVVYSELAKSIAEGGRPAIREIPSFGWGEVYPTLIAPAWALFDDPVRAYHAALGINALLMSLAAIPAYFLARMFVTRKSSILVAAMTVLVPSMAYTGVVMTENACYPIFLLALLLVARVCALAVAHESGVRAGRSRPAGVDADPGNCAGRCLLRRRGDLRADGASRSGAFDYLRKFVPTAAVAGVVVLSPVLASVVRGEGLFGWLGARSGTFAEFHPHEIPEWFAYLTAGMILYVAVAPADRHGDRRR